MGNYLNMCLSSSTADSDTFLGKQSKPTFCFITNANLV